MNYAAQKIQNKLCWMCNQLRWKNNVDEILGWTEAMKSLNSLLVNILKPMDERITIQRKERSRKDTSMFRRSSKELDAADARVEKLTTMVEKLIARENTEEEESQLSRKTQLQSCNERAKRNSTNWMSTEDEYVQRSIGDCCWETKDDGNIIEEEIIRSGFVEPKDSETTKIEHTTVNDGAAGSTGATMECENDKCTLVKETEWVTDCKIDKEQPRAEPKLRLDRSETETIAKGWPSMLTDKLNNLESSLRWDMENKLELWKAGLITRVRLEKKGIKYWGDTNSKPFTKLLRESARDE